VLGFLQFLNPVKNQVLILDNLIELALMGADTVFPQVQVAQSIKIGTEVFAAADPTDVGLLAVTGADQETFIVGTVTIL